MKLIENQTEPGTSKAFELPSGCWFFGTSGTPDGSLAIQIALEGSPQWHTLMTARQPMLQHFTLPNCSIRCVVKGGEGLNATAVASPVDSTLTNEEDAAAKKSWISKLIGN